MLSGIEKTVIAKKPFTASLDGINIKSYAEGDLITGPIEVINDIIANGWATNPKEKAKDQEEDIKMAKKPENKGSK